MGTIAERVGDDCYNTCVLSFGGEIKARYRKVHLFDREKELFTPGDLPFDVYDLRGVKVGMMICFDWVFPEAMRALALKGAQIVCHPSNLVLPYCPRAMITRCIENGVYAITTNRVGNEARGGSYLWAASPSIYPSALASSVILSSVFLGAPAFLASL